MNRSDHLKNEAEVLARGLELGVTSAADVAPWIDAAIAAEEHAADWLCELATMGASYEQDLARVLRGVPGVADEAWVRDELVRRLARGLAADPRRADPIARALYELALAKQIPDRTLASLAGWAWDALDMADQGLVEDTRERVVAEMLAALTDAAAKTQR